MEYTYVLYPLGSGFGFKLLYGEQVIIDQPTDTDGGYEPMSESRATTFALELIERLK